MTNDSQISFEANARIFQLILAHIHPHIKQKELLYGLSFSQQLTQLKRANARPSSPFRHVDPNRALQRLIFRIGDPHTRLIPDATSKSVVFFLPFLVEVYWEDDTPYFLVTHTDNALTSPFFKPGIIVTHWNGYPILDFVKLLERDFSSSNPFASFDRAVERLTIRPQVAISEPLEDHVVVHFKTLDGLLKTESFYWTTFDARQASSTIPTSTDNPLPVATKPSVFCGLHTEQLHSSFLKRSLYSLPNLLRAANDYEDSPINITREFNTSHSEFRLLELEIDGSTVTYLRIWSFSPMSHYPSPQSFVSSFVNQIATLISEASQECLIIDVRGNSGGFIPAAEFLLQLFTPLEITPVRAQFRKSEFLYTLLSFCPSLVPNGRRADVLSSFTEFGEFSSAHFLSKPSSCNKIGQVFFGPIALIVDSGCYSSCEFFAAGFQDHRIGPVFGTSERTAGGGSEVWTSQYLLDCMQSFGPSKYTQIQNDLRSVDMTFSARRIIRSNANDCLDIETVGVRPCITYLQTRDDLLHSNRDMLRHVAANLLATCSDQDVIRITVSQDPLDDLRFSFHAKNADATLILVDGLPCALGRSDEIVSIKMPDVGSVIEIRAHVAERVVASKKYTTVLKNGTIGLSRPSLTEDDVSSDDSDAAP